MKTAHLIISVIFVAVAAANAFAATNTYVFDSTQSTVVQTGGFAGIHETHTVTGLFQLTVDFSAGTAWLDLVDATLSESPFLYTQSLGELFNMTGLNGVVVSNTRIEFEGKTTDHSEADILIAVTLLGDSLHLTGEIDSPCCDFFNFDLDAVATFKPLGWTYHYFDDFSTDKAEKDSYTHSVFWPRGAFPPAEPYLYYYGEGDNRVLAFAGYRGQLAHLGYCFPIGQGQGKRLVRGTFEIDVQFPSDAEILQSPPGYMLYSISGDGVNWSIPTMLEPGHHNIAIESLHGTCYVILIGTRAVIDNLKVRLYSPPATIYVPNDFDTIQEAIDFAADGDVIEVAPGIYDGPGNWDIDFRGKAITLRSAEGPDTTIIDCSYTWDASSDVPGHRGFYFHQSETAASVLRGFTIRGAIIHGSDIPPEHMPWHPSPAHPIGGGIYCEFSSPTIINCFIQNCGTELGGGIGCVSSAATIANCVIEECHAGGFGNSRSGGYGCGIGLIRNCNAKIEECIIRNNLGYYNSCGGGIYCQNSSALIQGCDISDNRAPGNLEGGGIYCAGPSTQLTAQNCVISLNSAWSGAGIFTFWGIYGTDTADNFGYSRRCSVRVTNCTIAHNRLTGPEMLPMPGGGIHSISSNTIVKNSIIWYNDGTPVVITHPASNSPVIYSDVEGGYLGQGNIDEDPLFAPVDVPDYHLQSIYGRYDPRIGTWIIDRDHSPCIDAGDPSDPVRHEPVPNGNRINMGAYGGTRQASKGVAYLIHHVDGVNGDDSNNGLSRSTAFATIQRGINASRDDDTVLVWPAIYREEVDFAGKAITVQSAADAAVVTTARGYAFSFFKGEGESSVLRNFVIQNSEYGIFCNGASPTITNITIVNGDFGIAAYGGAKPHISNCILWNNIKGDLFQCEAIYSCFRDITYALWQGNINKDPLFADPDSGDYHLRSRYGRYWPPHNVWVIDYVRSPCIDAGDPEIYPRRERMPHGGRLNMGAYGGTPHASMSKWPLKGDINEDGVVNMKDFVLMAESWLDSLPWTPRVLREEAETVMPMDGSVISISPFGLQYRVQSLDSDGQ